MPTKAQCLPPARPPADITLDVVIMEAGDPPRNLAYYRLHHAGGDPPGAIRVTTLPPADDPWEKMTHLTSIIPHTADRQRMKFLVAQPLAESCDGEGNLRLDDFRRADALIERGFELSLREWLGERAEARRVITLLTLETQLSYCTARRRRDGEGARRDAAMFAERGGG